MRAVISKSDSFVGTSDRFITNEYKNITSILNIAKKFSTKINHSVRVEIWRNWQNRYNEADQVIVIEFPLDR